MTNADHLDKIEKIIKEVRTCMMATMNDSGEMRARPMATADYDEHGNVWFFTDNDSAKVDELSNQQPNLITYSKTSDNTYLSMTGKIEVVKDLAKQKEKFSVFAKAWYPDGPESEDLILLKFVPQKAEYWDSPDSTIVQMWRIGKAVVTGTKYQTADDEHGKVTLK